MLCFYLSLSVFLAVILPVAFVASVHFPYLRIFRAFFLSFPSSLSSTCSILLQPLLNYLLPALFVPSCCLSSFLLAVSSFVPSFLSSFLSSVPFRPFSLFAFLSLSLCLPLSPSVSVSLSLSLSLSLSVSLSVSLSLSLCLFVSASYQNTRSPKKDAEKQALQFTCVLDCCQNANPAFFKCRFGATNVYSCFSNCRDRRSLSNQSSVYYVGLNHHQDHVEIYLRSMMLSLYSELNMGPEYSQLLRPLGYVTGVSKAGSSGSQTALPGSGPRACALILLREVSKDLTSHPEFV